MEDLLNRINRSDRAAISKAITIIEDELPGYEKIYREVLKKAGKAFKVGIAGPPGAGKSTLINCLTKEFRSRRFKVAVVAVDPSSPISGGAILGDRVRMLEHSLDEGVFIRSLASRGSLGGLSKATRRVISVLDAAGYDIILVETVGVGQTELDVARVADVTVVVLMPQTGDEVQAMKAGLLEIGDVFVMNKSDIEGADRAIVQIASFLAGKDGKKPPIVKTVARRCEGISLLADHLIRMKENLSKNRAASTERIAEELRQEISERMEAITSRILFDGKMIAKYAEQVSRGELDVQQAVEKIISEAMSTYY
ncbi:MAG: methylmalonyl Co-A mutase-associated GTPase MeaB [Conexivisphaerales archaeon]